MVHETELHLILVQHFAIDLGSTLSHLGDYCGDSDFGVDEGSKWLVEEVVKVRGKEREGFKRKPRRMANKGPFFLQWRLPRKEKTANLLKFLAFHPTPISSPAESFRDDVKILG